CLGSMIWRSSFVDSNKLVGSSDFPIVILLFWRLFAKRLTALAQGFVHEHSIQGDDGLVKLMSLHPPLLLHTLGTELMHDPAQEPHFLLTHRTSEVAFNLSNQGLSITLEIHRQFVLLR